MAKTVEELENNLSYEKNELEEKIIGLEQRIKELEDRLNYHVQYELPNIIHQEIDAN